MLADYFEAGGPVMYLILAAWVVVLAGVMDRLLYALMLAIRRPMLRIRRAAAAGERAAARALHEEARRQASRGLQRIDSVSQIATSLGLFGTVLGISQAFFARGGELGLAAPEVLASGLATALFTTVAGLVVFLFGQAFLIAWHEWQEHRDRKVAELLERMEA